MKMIQLLNQLINYLISKGLLIKQNNSSQNYVINNESIINSNININSNKYLNAISNRNNNWNENNIIEKINNIEILRRKRFIIPQIMAHIIFFRRSFKIFTFYYFTKSFYFFISYNIFSF